MKSSAHSQIERNIGQMKPSRLIFPSDFRGLGSDVAIKNALSRLTKDKKIERLAHGIYYLAQDDPKFGKLLPSMEKIAKEVARHAHIKIKPAGAFALHKLGLSTQVPLKQVYLTDGLPKRLKIGKATIIFKSTTPKKFAMKGTISSLLIQALEELDPTDIILDRALKNKITDLRSKENPRLLQHDLKLAPSRISDFIYKSYLTKPE